MISAERRSLDNSINRSASAIRVSILAVTSSSSATMRRCSSRGGVEMLKEATLSAVKCGIVAVKQATSISPAARADWSA